MPRTLVLRPPAKINLTLRVGPRRADGLHDVRTLMQSIAIADTLALTARAGLFSLNVHGLGVPADRENLVWRAAELLWRASGRAGEPRDVHVHLDKSIPMAAGLGGGSADAAAALVGLNVIWNTRRTRPQLIGLSAELGSDVPFFLQGGTALCAGRGEEIYPVDDVSRLGIIVVKPSIGVATADAYRWLDEDRQAKPDDDRRSSLLDLGWPSGPIDVVNDLERPVATRHPVVAEIVDACRRAGARAAAMTGSGSAVFAAFSEPAAKRAVRRLRRPDWLVMLTRTLTRREAARRIGL
ncbi:MAG TPA: 4-(cytidine 5'-diphospho)-2-C-methyl-D-erythritol kinase [Vicinamibacterales bacterium]|nr:4-(cytidine 5'-diphospho)-2-C-methyl-D-erythritol kinase [Vicinamibacterales bacterium]